MARSIKTLRPRRIRFLHIYIQRGELTSLREYKKRKIAVAFRAFPVFPRTRTRFRNFGRNSSRARARNERKGESRMRELKKEFSRWSSRVFAEMHAVTMFWLWNNIISPQYYSEVYISLNLEEKIDFYRGGIVLQVARSRESHNIRHKESIITDTSINLSHYSLCKHLDSIAIKPRRISSSTKTSPGEREKPFGPRAASISKATLYPPSHQPLSLKPRTTQTRTRRRRRRRRRRKR